MAQVCDPGHGWMSAARHLLLWDGDAVLPAPHRRNDFSADHRPAHLTPQWPLLPIDRRLRPQHWSCLGDLPVARRCDPDAIKDCPRYRHCASELCVRQAHELHVKTSGIFSSLCSHVLDSAGKPGCFSIFERTQ